MDHLHTWCPEPTALHTLLPGIAFVAQHIPREVVEVRWRYWRKVGQDKEEVAILNSSPTSTVGSQWCAACVSVSQAGHRALGPPPWICCPALSLSQCLDHCEAPRTAENIASSFPVMTGILPPGLQGLCPLRCHSNWDNKHLELEFRRMNQHIHTTPGD